MPTLHYLTVISHRSTEIYTEITLHWSELPETSPNLCWRSKFEHKWGVSFLLETGISGSRETAVIGCWSGRISSEREKVHANSLPLLQPNVFTSPIIAEAGIVHIFYVCHDTDIGEIFDEHGKLQPMSLLSCLASTSASRCRYAVHSSPYSANIIAM